MRDVTDESRCARFAADDFRPLIPVRRTPIAHEEFEQLLGALAPTQANKRAEIAQFVRRICVPVRIVTSLVEFAPVTLERRIERIRRQHLLLASG